MKRIVVLSSLIMVAMIGGMVYFGYEAPVNAQEICPKCSAMYQACTTGGRQDLLRCVARRDGDCRREFADGFLSCPTSLETDCHHGFEARLESCSEVRNTCVELFCSPPQEQGPASN